jgi:hypothetical protein
MCVVENFVFVWVRWQGKQEWKPLLWLDGQERKDA